MRAFRRALWLLLTLLAVQCGRKAADIDGSWRASIVSNGVSIPFRLELDRRGNQAEGVFFDGDRKIASSNGALNGNNLQLHFDVYNSDLSGVISNDKFQGNYVVHKPGKDYSRPVTAERGASETANGPGAQPSIAGDWELRSTEDKTEVAWKMVVKQNDDRIEAAILRLDGDTGALTGEFRNNKLRISHFSGARPALLEGSLQPDGTMDLLLNGKNKLRAVRATDANAKTLAPEPDAFHTTTVKTPSERFHFSAPDAYGMTISDSDPQFQNKAIIASVGGTWCPNCMDEAPFLVDLYRKYHAQGLEIVGLNFESGDMDYDRTRVKSFIARYGIPYSVIIAGTTDNAASKLPQLVNFSAFPTTVFIGRDGRVRGVHDGFASVATGQEHVKLKAETEHIVEGLLRQ